MTSLVSVTAAKKQLNISHDSDDLKIDQICEEATALVILFLKELGKVTDSPIEWTEDTVPALVRAMILRVVVNLYTKRGDDTDTDPIEQIRTMANLLRVPTLAA